MTRRDHLKSILQKVQYYDQDFPNFYLTMDEFAERMEVSKQAIHAAVLNGRIPRDALACYKKKTRLIPLIHWNKASYNYAKYRKLGPPEDFKENDEKVYNIILDPEFGDGLGVGNKPSGDETDLFKAEDNIVFGEVVDLNTAKYRTEILKIIKAQDELKLKRNETIAVEDVIAKDRQIAAEIKAAFKQFIRSAAPELAAESNVLKVREILNARLNATVSVLANTEGDA